jgi:flagellin
MSSPIGIQTNVSSLMVHRQLSVTSRDLQRSVGRLSSGLRIMSAADDAAGIAVSQGLEATIRSIQQAQRNANDGVAMIQTTEGAYQTLADMLVRMRELAIQAANDTLTDDERGFLDTEYQLLLEEIERVSAVTEYNGILLLDGSAGDGLGNITLQVGARNTVDDRLAISLPQQSPIALGVAFSTVESMESAQFALDAIDFALDNLNTDRASLGANLNRLQEAIENLGVSIENLSDAQSRIRDSDIAVESSRFAGEQVLMQAGVAMLAQSNRIPDLALQLLNR